jgi:stearoyl-CoA desaturase (delta-9 desaturase)
MMNLLASSTRGAQTFMVLSIIGTVSALALYDISASSLLLIFLGYFLYGCLGIVVTYHRQLTHNSYKTNSLLTKVFSILGCFAGTGSPLAWVAIHINHHLKSDKPEDPHSPLYKGIKIFKLDYINQVDSNTKWRMRKLITDRFQQFLHRYYFAILATYSISLFVIGGFWLMIFLHWAPAAITGLMSNVVNYVGHKPSWFGAFRTYNLKDQSANNWLWAIPSWGESWHNNHHRHPKNFSLGEKWWQIDISALIIRLIKTKNVSRS